jgi:hypothetical protein
MGLESTTTIGGLVATNPVASDALGQADDHLRLLKNVLKTTFPGAGGAGFTTPIIATETELNYVNGVTSAIQTQLNTIGGDATTALADATTALENAATADDKAVAALGAANLAQGTANTAQAMAADAWACFDGSGALKKGYNIASVVRDSLGTYTVTFTGAMPNSTYAAIISCSNSGNASWVTSLSDSTKIRIIAYDISSSLFDPDYVGLAIFAVS